MTYSIDALKKNRVSALLYGGTEADRRAIAVAATLELDGAGLIEAKDADTLERALTNSRAVVYVPDVTTIPPNTQRAVPWTWELIELEGRLVGANTGLPNKLVGEA